MVGLLGGNAAAVPSGFLSWKVGKVCNELNGKAFKDDLNIQVLVEDLFASSSGKDFICQAGSENT